jgi:hypothetical protein
MLKFLGVGQRLLTVGHTITLIYDVTKVLDLYPRMSIMELQPGFLRDCNQREAPFCEHISSMSQTVA